MRTPFDRGERCFEPYAYISMHIDMRKNCTITLLFFRFGNCIKKKKKKGNSAVNILVTTSAEMRTV